jgi:hypothetical protein
VRASPEVRRTGGACGTEVHASLEGAGGPDAPAAAENFQPPPHCIYVLPVYALAGAAPGCHGAACGPPSVGTSDG